MGTAEALIVTPFRRSKSIVSRTCSVISRSETVPVSCSRRSARVDFPWSMWAMMQKLRMCDVSKAGFPAGPRDWECLSKRRGEVYPAPEADNRRPSRQPSANSLHKSCVRLSLGPCLLMAESRQLHSPLNVPSQRPRLTALHRPEKELDVPSRASERGAEDPLRPKSCVGGLGHHAFEDFTVDAAVAHDPA